MDIVRRGHETVADKAARATVRLPILFLALALVLVIALIACGRPLPTPTALPTGTAVPTRIPPPPTVTSTVVPTPTLVPIDERPFLGALYLSTDGGNWTRNDNWLTDAPLGEWYGVTTQRHGARYYFILGRK